MKKSKILVLALTLMLLVGVVFATVASAYTHANSASGSSLASDSWIAAPEKALVKCQGGDCDHTGCDYVYSFALVGDTQNLNYIDAQNYTAAKAENDSLTYADYTAAYMRTLYNWIIANKDAKNIQYVMGLGDITQSFNSTQTYYNDEWPLAKEALSLLDGVLGYSLVRGNHDISSGLNGQFGVGSEYYNTLMALAATNDAEGRPMAAFRDANKIEDSYRKIVTSNGDKYIIYTLEYYPTEETIAWLNDTLSANADYTAIVTLHSFLNRDATFVNEFETTTPAEDAANSSWKETATGGNVDTASLWERSLSKHANVKFIFSGHVDVEDVVVNQLKGDNGNTVTCMLIDCQTIDSKVEPAGVVTMLYVNADGTVVNVEHISTVRAAAGKDAYLKAQNQFELTVDYGTAWVETKYGAAPKSEYDAHIFNVFIDDDTNAETTNFYFGGFDTWNDALAAIHAWNGIGSAEARAMKTYNILLKEDYTHSAGIPSNKSGSNPGHFNLDLNGKTMTLSKNGVLVPYYIATTYNTPSFTVQNGDIVMAGTKASPMVALQCAKYNDGAYEVTLEDLDITYTSATAGSIVGMYPGNDGYKSYMKVNVTDCDIDVSAIDGAITLFGLNDQYDNLDTTVTVSGGSFKGNTSLNLKVSTLNNGDSVSFASDAEGNYTTFVLNENVAPTGVFKNEKGQILGFATESTTAPYTFSAYVAPVESTPYGDIPSDLYPAQDYPFVLFNEKKELIGAYAHWYDYIDEHKSGTLLMRRNYDTTENTADYPNKLYLIENLVLDLGGYTLSQSTGTSTKLIFSAARVNNESFNCNITVKNGTIVEGKNYAAVVVFQTTSDSANDTTAECEFNFVFDNVTFTTTADYTGRPVLECWNAADPRAGTENTVVFNDCTFDVINDNVTIFFRLMEGDTVAKEGGISKQDVDVTINGGTVNKSGTKSLKIASFSSVRNGENASGDSLKWGANANGEYTKFVYPAGAALEKLNFEFVNNADVRTFDVSTDANAIYQLSEYVTTPYGLVIPKAYSDAKKYPILIFKNGSVVATESLMSAAYTKAHAQVQGSATDVVTIYLQKDITEKLTASFSNTEKIKGTLVIDLGGNTYTTSGKALFQLNSKNVANSPKIEVRNGRLNTVRLFALANQTTERCQKYDVVFKNVTLGLTKSHWGDMISTNATAGSAGCYAFVNLTFEDCVFDLVTNQGGTSYRLMDLANDTDNHAVNVVFKGGEIIYGNVNLTLASIKSGYSDNKHFVTGASDSDTVKFEKGANGYTVFKGASAPTNVYDSTELTFVKISNETYTLALAALVNYEFTPKTSITLSNALIYNVYVPVTAELKSFTLDGVTYADLTALAESIVTLSDGKQYYLFEIELPSAEAARNITLQAVVTLGGKDYKGSFTMSIPKYAAKVIAEGTDVEKTLAKDVLAYVKSAYNYFADYNTAEEIARVNALINSILGNYTAAPTISGETANDKGGIVTGVTLNLDYKPTIRFYVTDTNVEFKIGNRVLDVVKDVDGAYVELDVNAYALAETITFGDGGSYHISDFLTKSAGETYETLVACFVKYVESAAAYRNSVINK